MYDSNRQSMLTSAGMADVIVPTSSSSSLRDLCDFQRRVTIKESDHYAVTKITSFASQTLSLIM